MWKQVELTEKQIHQAAAEVASTVGEALEQAGGVDGFIENLEAANKKLRGRPKRPMIVASKKDMVNSPAHYVVGGMETIDFIEAKNLGYHLGNCIKYISRADHKGDRLEDLKKARWYLEREIQRLEKTNE